MVDYIKYINDLFKKNVGNNLFFIICLIILIVATIYILPQIKIEELEIWHYIIIVLVVVIFVFGWVSYSKVPKVSKNHIGYVISITTNDEQEVNIKNEFVEEIKKLLMQTEYQYPFQLIDYKPHIARRITGTKEATAYILKTKAHFMLYGKLKKGKLQGVESYYLEANYTVRHAPIIDEIRKELVNDMVNIMRPGKIFFKSDDELIIIPLWSKYLDKAAKYVIAFASMISNDFQYAKNLLESILIDISDTFSSNKLFEEKVKTRYIDASMEIARKKYHEYRIKKDIESLEDMKRNLDDISEIKGNYYQSNLFRAIYYFYKKDIRAAKMEINKSRNGPDNIWRFSDAFLYAYEGEIEKALKNYKRLLKYNYQPETVFDVEEFIQSVIEEEPEKEYLYFFLGMINFYLKEDYLRAKKDFIQYLRCRSYRQFLKEIALEHIKQCKEMLKSQE